MVHAAGRYGDSELATDYDRACDCLGPAALLDVGPTWGLVLAAHGHMVAWLTAPNEEEGLIALVAATDDDRPEVLESIARAQSSRAWTRLTTKLEVQSGGVLLLHAAWPPAEVIVHESSASGSALQGDGIQHALPPGHYAVDWCHVNHTHGPGAGVYTFIRFQPAPRSGDIVPPAA